MQKKENFCDHKYNVDFINAELEHISNNIESVKNLKTNTIEEIEALKLKLRHENPARCVVNQREIILEELDQDTSLIQNRCDFICNDLKRLKSYIDDRLILINKNDFIMNLLNYKLYEVEFNFSRKIKQLQEIKKQLENSDISPSNESKIAMRFIENEKKITDCETMHEQRHFSVRQQMLEAQLAYEKSVNILDECVDVMKKNFNTLMALMSAYNEHTRGHSNLENILEIDEIRGALENCKQMSSSGWREAPQNITDFAVAHGLRFTEDGLMITESGREITYSEAVEKKMLDNVKLVDLFRSLTNVGVQGEAASEHQSEETTTSEEEKMVSEDVCYLKECLGVPLTLALAEITAVQPRDPIHYLGHWLFKYRYNEEMTEKQTNEINELTNERNRIAQEKWKKFLEEEARAAVIDMIVKAEEEAIRNELRRMELQLAEAEENYDEEDTQPSIMMDF
ncbi:unnamed protein product [Phyllotreta striolata]|uniref:Uncharacterized protein n=1 Tax=Phyllotreta striolata TaxID=444603 RepID=A0A9P0DV57_PHYSR|nr:unnamed protein product [Phyllotreta striolata]